MALRRRLSDKDKERRLVRRSSSKRKDKENGGTDKAGGQVPVPIIASCKSVFRIRSSDSSELRIRTLIQKAS